jgi:competence protein ComEC
VTSGVILAAAAVAGAAIGALVDVRASAALAAALAGGSLALLPGWPRRVSWALLLVSVGSLALAHAARARADALTPPLATWLAGAAGDGQRADGPVLVRGRLAEDAVPVSGGVELTIDVSALGGLGDDWRPMEGRLQARVAGDLAGRARDDWLAGRAVVAPITLRQPPITMNPGGPGSDWQRLRRRYDVAGTIKSSALVEIAPGRWWSEAAAAVRRYVRHAVGTFVGPRDGTSSAIVTAILIGDRAGLDPAVVLRLQRAGTYHVIAISGGNVALLGLVSFALLRGFVRSPRVLALAILALVVAYAGVVRGEPSVERAVTAAVVYLGLSLAGIVPRALPVLALTAVVILIANPLTVIDVGAWLSFGATLGILLCARRFDQWMSGRGSTGRLGRALTALVGATLAAELALLPVSVGVFGRVGVAGLLLNVVAIPAMAVVEVAGMAVVLMAVALPPAAAVAGVIAARGARVLVESAALVDRVPWLSWRVAPSPVVWTVIYYAAAGLLIAGVGPRLVRRLTGAAWAAATLVIVTAPGLGARAPRPGVLRVTMIDIGQGDALALQFPAGHSLLVDAGGGGPGFDVGSRTITPVLWGLGVRRLDWLAITHDDLDHIGGAVGITADMRPREIWEGVPVPPNVERQALRKAASAAAIVWRQLQAGDHFEVDGVFVDVRHPPLPDWERQRVRNDDSLVLAVRYGRVEILLTGDAESEYEARARADPAAPPLRVLKVAHHGSRTSSSERFLDAFRPQVALVSAGRGNPFGHPAPEVLARLTRAGAEIFRTDRDGAIVLETDGRSLRLSTMSGREWRLDGDWP